MYLHLKCVFIRNWIVWNGSVFNIETVLNWIVWNKTDLYKNGFGIK